MTCYKIGGCGVYENRSCSECPASKPEYLDKVNTIGNDLIEATCQIAAPCLICGEDVPIGFPERVPVVCDKCKDAVMKIRKMIEVVDK